MTNDNHPITPPDELVEQWIAEIWHEGTPVRIAASDLHLAAKSSQWGYEQRGADIEAKLQKARDEELEACFEHLKRLMTPRATIDYLRAAMRPKPPSLSESALDLIDKIEYNAMTKNAGNEKAWDLKELEVVRRALKRLQELEGQGDG